MNKFVDINFSLAGTQNPKDLFCLAQEIYRVLSDEEKQLIDDNNINLHKSIKFAIPSESFVADELLIYSSLLLKNDFVNDGLELLHYLIPNCTWKLHFFLQNHIPQIFKNHKEDKAIYTTALHYACADFKYHNDYLKMLKGATMPLWQSLLNELISQKNFYLAEQICNVAIKHEVPYGENGYVKKLNKIKELKEKELTKIKENNFPEVLMFKDNLFLTFYYRFKKKLFENNLYEDIEIKKIDDNFYVMYYHDYLIYGLRELSKNTILFINRTQKESFHGVQIALDEINNIVKDIKESLSKLFLI